MLSVWPRAIGAQRRDSSAKLNRPLDRIDVGTPRRKHGPHDYRARYVAWEGCELDRKAVSDTSAPNVGAAKSRLGVRPTFAVGRELLHPTSGDRRFRRRFISGRRSGRTAGEPSRVGCRDGRSSARYVTQHQLGCFAVSRGVVLAMLLLTAGCAVPQKPGKGMLTNLVEANSGRRYWLYLPASYSDQASPSEAAKDSPLVVTLHGMKPFDNYNAQIREWQQQADAYGLIVCAPDLHTSDLLMELPLRHVHPYVQRDERMIMDMIDQVLARTNADSSRVLITSWSSGGYLAHYLLNRYPERFACLAVRQSNFSADILDPQQIRQYPRYPDTPIAIFFGQNDLLICRNESRAAVAWYREHGFRQVEAYSVQGLGHERTPETAASFFARVCRFQPLDKALAQRSLARVRTQPVALASAQPTAAEAAAPLDDNPHRQEPATPERAYSATDALGRLTALSADKQPGG